MQETPDIKSMAYSSTAVAPWDQDVISQAEGRRRLQAAPVFNHAGIQAAVGAALAPAAISKAPPVMISTLRIVKIVIADPNENLPLDKRVLYNGDEMTTDLNDQELFYEVDIKTLLAKHNEVRAATVDKKASAAKQANVMLEPVRIRDLKMVVVAIASF